MSGPYLLLLLFLAIGFIIYGTARLKVHPFLILLVTAYGLGLAGGLSPGDTISAITGGLGGTIGYIGIVIAAGTIIGVILEQCGGALVMARTVIRWVGKTRAALAMGLTGAVVSIPVFCDSGYIILSPLNRSLVREAKASMATFAVSLSMGLYATHVLVPPTPGPMAAAGELGADIGMVMLLGLVTTIPVLFASLAFARFMGQRIYIDPDSHEEATSPDVEHAPEPETLDLPAWKAFLPILAPMVLIAVQSIAALPGQPLGEGTLFDVLSFLGNPNTALLLGVGLAGWIARGKGSKVLGAWVGKALQAAGPIILITGAGGALGRVLRATPIGDYLGETLATLDLGLFSIFLPFLVAAAFKTALGSSTVAIITTASILVPLLEALGLATGLGPVLVTLAIGAGAMTVSHANDSYFWVVSQFSNMSVTQAYQLQTVGSAVAGVAGILTLFVLRLILM